MPLPSKTTVAKMTIAQYVARLKKIRAERDRLADLPDTDAGRLPGFRKVYEERARLLEPLEALFRELVDGDALEFQYEGDPEKTDDRWLMFDLHDVDFDPANGVLTLLSFGVGPSSDPPPPLETLEGESLLRVISNESEVVRVPVTSHLIVADRIEHQDHTHKSIRQVALLADDFYSSDQGGDVEVVGVQPSTRLVDAVFGIVVDNLKPSDVAIMSIDALLQSRQIILLGYEYDGQQKQWQPELETLREVITHEREPGVVIDGKFRRLPRLDLTTPGEDDGPPAEAT